MKSSTFIDCEKCGKHLIERSPSGVWHFVFGKGIDDPVSPVDMFIIGSIKIKCMRKSCNHWNTLTKFPEVISNGTNECKGV